MNTPLVSMIIPAYNTEKFLERCVESVCAQSYPEEYLEIIIVDDGSTDSTGAVADKLAKKHGNIRVIHRENGGSSAARNSGIKQARGDYLGFVDSDDFISEDMVSLLVRALEEYGVRMAQVSREELSDDGKRLPDICIPPAETVCITGEEHLRQMLLHKGDASFCTRLTAKELFEEELFPEGKLNEDFYLMTKMMPRVDRLALLPYRGYHVWYRTGSNARKNTEDRDHFPPMFTDMVENADLVSDQIKRDFPGLSKEAMRFGLYQRLEYLLHIPISRMRRKDAFYSKIVVGFVRAHMGDVLTNPYLTGKNRLYLLLLGLMPLATRRIHALTMKFRGLE